MTKAILKLINTSHPQRVVIQEVRYCDTFFSKALGLMFSRELEENNGIILAEKSESRINTAIHMFFVNYDITVLWLEQNMRVVDKVLAKKWRPFYMSAKPAQYVVELHRCQFLNFNTGDQLALEYL